MAQYFGQKFLNTKLFIPKLSLSKTYFELKECWTKCFDRPFFCTIMQAYCTVILFANAERIRTKENYFPSLLTRMLEKKQ